LQTIFKVNYRLIWEDNLRFPNRLHNKSHKEVFLVPFKSKAQARFMFAKHPKIAKEWASKTPSIKKLPQHSKKK
jgi:hypothetical protein